jgi:hypothetical protein
LVDNLPPAIYRNGRPRDDAFTDEEVLYRRVEPGNWHQRLIDIAAIALPDMSVGRSKYGHPEWLRLEGEQYADWAVVGFRVGDIPRELLHVGTDTWTFTVRHLPLDDNYPHSEVWGYRNGAHMNAKAALEPDVHLRWRSQLRWRIRTFLRPYERAEIRQDPPAI